MTEYYKSRYRKRRILEWWHGKLIDVIIVISETKFSKMLSHMDRFEVSRLNQTKTFNKYFLEHSNIKISLRNIEFIEAIELDDLETVEKQILRIIRENKFFTIFGSDNNLSASEITEIKNKLKGFKSSFKTWSEGKLFSLSNKESNEDSDLFETIAFSYFKTYDNLLILKLNVTPSKKFYTELRSIEENKSIPSDYITISHFKDFLRTKRIIKGFRAAGNLKEIGLQNLIFDLNFQINKKILFGLGGVFSRQNNVNPFIAYFNTQNKLDYRELNRGFGIIDSHGTSEIFYDQNNGYYAINYWNESKKNKGLYIIGEDDAFPKKYDSNKSLEQYCFSRSIFKSWATIHYLRDLSKELNHLRKTIYHFINSNSKIKFRQQVKIKSKLSKKKIRFQRIQREFSKENIYFYFMSHDYKSDLLCAVNTKWSNSKNYFSFIKNHIDYYIKDGDEQISDLDKYFEEVSSINLIKLNYKFQIVATSLAIIGLVFAITNAEQIFKLIISLWE